MKPPSRRSDMLGHRSGKSDDIVLGDLLDLLDACNVEPATLPNIARGVSRHNACAGHRLGSGHLNLQPGLVLPLVAPQATHLWARVTSNHLRDSFSHHGGNLRQLPECQPLRR